MFVFLCIIFIILIFFSYMILIFVQDLKDFMRQAGEVTYADAHKREKNMG